MAVTVGQADSDAEQEVMSAINTTPLVDVMLVLLIIFLITIPAIIQQVPLELPRERNIPNQTKPENIVIAINRDGDVFWNMEFVKDSRALFEKLKKIAVIQPQPEVHIRGDLEVRYEAIGRVIVAAALIMGTVFAAFILTSDRISKEFGLLLAVAILTDALIVKMTLVPSFLTLMGEKSWYIPRWLDRILPNITIEPPHDGEAAPTGARRPAEPKPSEA